MRFLSDWLLLWKKLNAQQSIQYVDVQHMYVCICTSTDTDTDMLSNEWRVRFHGLAPSS